MTSFKQGCWNLAELVTDPKSAAFRKQLEEIDAKVRNFEKKKNYLKPNISTQKFTHLLNSLEEISEKFSKVSGYASLGYSADTQSDEATSLLTRMTKLGSQIENRTLYFDQWWKKQLDQKNADRLMRSSGELSEFLRFKRLLARYSLSEPEEKIINTLDLTGSTALVKLYDKITNAFRYVVKIDGKLKNQLSRVFS